MKKILVLIFTFALLSLNAQAEDAPHGRIETQSSKDREALRVEMNSMLWDIVSLDEGPKDGGKYENELSKKQAQRILKGITRIRKLDQSGSLVRNLDDLEELTKALLRTGNKNPVQAREYSDKIYQTCFGCHQRNRTTDPGK